MSGGSHLFPFGGYPCEGILTLYITFNAMDYNKNSLSVFSEMILNVSMNP